MKGKMIWGLARIALGWIFLWAFLDKVFGWGFATAAEGAWIRGGSPTFGFLSFATKGPFAETFQQLAGSAWVDWAFMAGLLVVGVGLVLGIFVSLASYIGAVMLILMFLAGFIPPEHNPVLDEHIVYALVLLGFAMTDAGDHLGLGKWWKGLPLVKQYKFLR